MSLNLLSVSIRREGDVVLARQRARTIARLLGFDVQDQTRLATATSEIARNAFEYAKGGQVDFVLEGRTPPQIFLVRVTDRGSGIRQLDRILRNEYESSTGMGLGLVGARRLVDRFHVDTSPQGTAVWLRKLLPPGTPVLTPAALDRLSRELAQERPEDPLSELQRQNRELLAALADLRTRQDELVRVNRELDDTNRGVVALYAELDERADHLRRADEMKSRFLSNMSHEFRTPLNSILALSRLLLGRVDGELTAEQDRQVGFIRKAAQDLSELVGISWISRRSRPARSSSVRAPSRSPTCSARSAACCARSWWATPCASCSRSPRVCRAFAPTRRRCRRSCGTSSRTR